MASKKAKKDKKAKIKIFVGAASLLAAALGGAGLGSVIDGVETDQGHRGVRHVQGVVDIIGSAHTAVDSAMTRSGVSADLVCELGRASNYPDRVYCYDGKTAGFLLPPGTASGLQSEIEAGLPEGTASERIIIKREGGGLKAHVSGYKLEDE